MKKNFILIASIGIFICICLMIFTIILLGNKEENVKEKSIEKEVIETYSDEEKLSPNAIFGLKKFYDECGHYVYEEAELPCELVNLTEQEIENYYTDWEVGEFSSNKLILVKEINGYCDEHYLMKLENGYINVYKLSTNGGLIVNKNTEISYKYLPEGDISELKNGIMIYGKDNIIEILENFE